MYQVQLSCVGIVIVILQEHIIEIKFGPETSDDLRFLHDVSQTVSYLFQFGRTEVIWNNLNPDFVKKFVMQYYFEQSQKLRFEVYVFSFIFDKSFSGFLCCLCNQTDRQGSLLCCLCISLSHCLSSISGCNPRCGDTKICLIKQGFCSKS